MNMGPIIASCLHLGCELTDGEQAITVADGCPLASRFSPRTTSCSRIGHSHTAAPVVVRNDEPSV